MESHQPQSELAPAGNKLVLGKCEMRPVLARLTQADIARHTVRIKADDGQNAPSYSSESEDDFVADPDYHPNDDQRRPSARAWAGRNRCGVAAPRTGKGRRKVKIERIKNKASRYTTFSKRKIGMMKKTHELAMLTGSQVLLVVVSETGHVYTNATHKLQPILTGKEGKALIQTCLNSPDPPSHYDPSRDERISSRGYEETGKAFQLSPESSRRPVAVGECHTEDTASLLDATRCPVHSGAQSTEAAAAPSTTTTMPLSNGLSLPITNPSSDYSLHQICDVLNTLLYPSNPTGTDEGCMHNGQRIPMVPESQWSS